MVQRPALYMGSFLILFFAIFFYAAYAHGVGLSDFRPSPELFGALLVTLSLFLIEYSRVSAAETGGLTHLPAIVLEVGFSPPCSASSCLFWARPGS